MQLKNAIFCFVIPPKKSGHTRLSSSTRFVRVFNCYLEIIYDCTSSNCVRNTIVFCILIEFQNVLFMNYVTLKSNVICYLCFCIHDRGRVLNKGVS